MDPNATLQLWRDAVDNNDWDGALEARLNLRVWIDSQGFEPNWEDDDERELVLYGNIRGLDERSNFE